MIADDEVGIEPPAQFAIELLGPVRVRDGDGDNLKLQVDRPRIRGLDCDVTCLDAHV
jgi:hypothetical protein